MQPLAILNGHPNNRMHIQQPEFSVVPIEWGEISDLLFLYPFKLWKRKATLNFQRALLCITVCLCTIKRFQMLPNAFSPPFFR